MTIDSVPELARRVRHLETLVKRGKPADGSDNASLLKRISALESSVARIGKAAPTKPQVYTPKPAAAIKVSDHGALTGLADNDHPQYLLAARGKAADSDKLDGLNSADFVKVSDPIGFWIPPAAFATDASWEVYGSNRVPKLVDNAVTTLDTFISLPTSGKRLELTGLMTSSTTGDIVTGVELRYLNEGSEQPDTASVSSSWVFTISPAYAIRKKTVILDVSGYSANSTFALRVFRNGANSADTCSGPSYFFGVSGRWID